ncbi:MAG TPA: tripartite tricarboxylate transporter TctB family protein [Burkholderiales bacterium]|nr:tripartite tricarboxylate transporter TctB family protein [Burkholderiales bacterium]
MTTTRIRLLRAAPYVLVGAAAGFLYYVASNFEFHRRAGTLGPDFWPKAILILAIAVCIYEVIRIAFSARGGVEVGGVLEDMVEESAEAQADFGAVVFAERHPLLLVVGMAATLGYVALVQTLGFFLSTALYLAGFLTLGGYRRRGVLVATSVLGALVLMFIFMKLVYVSLPIGVAPFSEVTLLLMKLMAIR